jgi:FkbM family methyltransferase
MELDHLVRAYDLAALQTAALFDLSSREGRAQSEAWLAGLFDQLTAAAEPQVVLELGAFGAEYSIRSRAALPMAEIHAFEANPHNVAHFGDAVARAGVCYHHLAIGDVVGEAVFNLARKEDGVALRPVRTDNSLRTRPLDIEYEEVRVPAATIDHFMAERGLAGRSAAMWIDLEGCAYEALVGAARTLEHTLLILVEVEDFAKWTGQKVSVEVMRHLMGLGFIPLARDFRAGRQHNHVFGRPDVLDMSFVRKALAVGFSEAGRLARARAAGG